MLNFKIELHILCQENIDQDLHKDESISITSQLKEIARDTKSNQIRSRLGILLDSDDHKTACAYDMLYHLQCLVTQLRYARKPSSKNKEDVGIGQMLTDLEIIDVVNWALKFSVDTVIFMTFKPLM